MRAKEIIKKIKRKRMYRAIDSFVLLNQDSYYGPSFDVRLQNPEKGHIYLETGEHCVLEGSYIFEKQTGHIKIGNRVHIGGSALISINEILIDDDVTIAWECLLYDHNSHPVEWEKRKNDTEREYKSIISGLNPLIEKDWSNVKSAPIHICSKAWIGTGVKILKGVTIGEGAVVAAGSIVTKDVEPWTMVGGNPAKPIKKLQQSI